MELVFAEPSDTKGIVEVALSLARSALRCDSHILASQRAEIPTCKPVIIHANVDGSTIEKVDLPALFANTRATQNGTFGLDLMAGDRIPVLCAASHLNFKRPNRTPDTLDLLLAVFGRKLAPDPEFPMVTFLTYDEYLLRVSILQVVSLIRQEYYARREVFKATRDLREHKVSADAARRLLELEAWIGLPVDSDLFACWLRDENGAFGSEQKEGWAFDETLIEAKKWLERIESGNRSDEIRELLFESHLLRLTKSKDAPLLSRRLAIAREAAGLS
jgi:hypothetical protein